MSTTFIFKTITPHHSEDWPLLRIVTYQIAASLPEFEQVLLWEIPWELTDVSPNALAWPQSHLTYSRFASHTACVHTVIDSDLI